MKDNVIITNKDNLARMKENIKRDGASKLHVVADFDKTLTSCFVNGRKIVSLISILRDEHYLTPDYAEKAQALYDKYHPFETDPNLSLDEKKRLMQEWWNVHYDLLIKSGLSKRDLEKVAQSEVSFRPGAIEFFKFLHKHNIPLIILSAAGIGTDAILLYLKRFNVDYANVHVVSNKFIWGDDNKIKGVEEPIIHNFNKDYTSVKKLPFYGDVENRKNVILLGDNISDTMMLDGFDYENVIKIGFFSETESADSIPPQFKEAYDVIVFNDGTMDFVNGLMGELVRREHKIAV